MGIDESPCAYLSAHPFVMTKYMPKPVTSNGEKVTLIVELLKMISRHDDLLHGWIKTLLIVQTGCSVGVAVVWKEAQILAPFVWLPLSVVAFAATVLCANAAIADLRWQGRYCAYVGRLDPTRTLYAHFADIDLTSRPSGYGRQAKLLLVMAIVLSIGWLSVGAFASWLIFCR